MTALDENSTIADVLAVGRRVWGHRATTTPDAAIILTVVAGDLARAVRDGHDGHAQVAGWDDIQREIGNLVLSAVRLADDLGLDPAAYLSAAVAAQRAYVAEHRGSDR